MITSTTDAIAINGRRDREDRPPEAERVAALEPPRPPEPEAALALLAALRPVGGSAVRAVAVFDAVVAEPDGRLVAEPDAEFVAAPAPKLVPAPALIRAVCSLAAPGVDCVTQDGLPPAAERALVREVS